MKTKAWKSGVGLLLAFTLLATACGGGGVDPAEYVATICGAMSTWADDIKATVDTMSSLDPTASADATKDSLASAFNELADSTEKLATTVEDAGTPSGDGGEEFANQLVTGFNDASQVMRDMATDIEKMSTSDPTAFATELMTTLGSGDFETSLTDAFGSLENIDVPELDKAAEESEACKEAEEKFTSMGSS